MLMLRLFLPLATLFVAGCQSTGAPPPLIAVPKVDLARFMGDWYVIANIPTFIEKGAHNAVESYRLDKDGTVATTFKFRAGRFDGEEKRYFPRGYVKPDGSNALWGMQFVWPIKADYQITYLDAAYQHTIISRQARDYVWVMARTPAIAEVDYQKLLAVVAAQGYDMSKVQRVPQQWK
jgi:apolipoprotein D and lipocalin family protein